MDSLSKLAIFKKLAEYTARFIKWVFKINFIIIRFIVSSITKYTGGGVVFGFISFVFLLLSLSSLYEFAESMLLYEAVESVPLFLLTGYFALKMIGYYRWDFIKNKRRDVKKALILVVALQCLTIAQFSGFASLVCFLSIPLAVLEWYPNKSYNYLDEKLDNITGLKTFLES